MGTSLHPVYFTKTSAVPRPVAVLQLDGGYDVIAVSFVPGQDLAFSVDDATPGTVVSGDNHAKLVVHSPRPHDGLPPIFAEQWRSRAPEARAMIAHDGKEKEVRPTEADHSGGFGCGTIHADVAPDSSDHGVEHWETIARQNAGLAFSPNGKVNFVVSALHLTIGSKEGCGVVYGIPIAFNESEEYEIAVFPGDLGKYLRFGAGEIDRQIDWASLYLPLKCDFG